MKKNILNLAVICLLILNACNKDGKIESPFPPKTTPNLGEAIWNVDTVNFQGPAPVRVDTEQIWSCNGTNSVQFFFSKMPTANGWFKVVKESKAYPNALAANECAIEINVGANDTYLSTGLDSDFVQVKVSNNKLNINCGYMKMAHIYIPTATALDTTLAGNAELIEAD